jgi:hypothetical protein
MQRGAVVGCSDEGASSSVFIQDGEFLDLLSGYQLRKMGSLHEVIYFIGEK